MDSTKGSNEKNQTKLLRKPRAPKPPPPPTSPPPKSHTNEGLHSSNPQYAFYPSNELETPAPSLSPPPPTELHSRPHSEIYSRSRINTRKSQRDYQKYGQYLLDAVHREKTSLGTYVEGQTLVKPYRARGPAALPYRPPKRNPPLFIAAVDEDEERYYETPAFTLQDFTLRVSQKARVPLENVQSAIFSRYTYKKLQKLLVDRCIPKHGELNTVQLELPDDVPSVSPRIPHQQLLLEMAALVKEQMSSVISTDMRSVIRPLPRYSPDYKPNGTRPQTEILLYEDHTKDRQKAISEQQQESELPGYDNIFHGGPPRYFQGGLRSNSPFAAADEGLINPSELAVLDSIMSGAVALSLKAHFISDLPDIEPLSRTITYLNLSFNDFRNIPPEVFDISQLTVLKLRNNPINDIPPEIGLLKNLKTFVISFCLVSSLPSSLFTLSKLEKLDLAYNKISFIPAEFRKLKHLRRLNVEGNLLPAMPAGALRLGHLKQVCVRNNFMHPLFWEENVNNQPQRLMDLSALMVTQTGLDRRCRSLPDHIAIFLQHYGKCDLCRGPLYGPGLRVIRPVSKIYGIKNLPFLFQVCSNHCLNMFSENSESLMDMLYGHGPEGSQAA